MRISRPVWLGIRIAAIGVLAWLVYAAFVPKIPDIKDAWARAEFRAVPLAVSAAIVLASYAVLIETWRRVVAAWGGTLPFGKATQIWFVSNLGKYLPGKIWTIAAMGTMSRNAGVPVVAAVGSSLLIAVLNILAGVVVVALTARDALSMSPVVAFGLAAFVLAITLSPRLISSSVGWIGARVGRTVTLPVLTRRAVFEAFAGCALAWVLYGIAFQFLVQGTVGGALGVPGAGATPEYIAVFTTSYIAGYLFLPAPGGIGAREVVLAGLLAHFQLAPVATAAVIVILSRVWLTILELVPGLVLLAFLPKPSSSTTHDV
jgi:uncharacterized membrane protein YbhN (UPF0104 family)